MRQRFLVFLVSAFVVSQPAAAQTAKELFRQAADAYDKSEWTRCAELFASAGAASTHDRLTARAFFAAAACSAAAGQKEAAFGFLEKAAAKGYHAFDRASINTQVKPLHDDPRWKTFLKGVEVRHAEHEGKNNLELQRIYEADQNDRSNGGTIDWDVVGKRDKARQERVQQILAEGGAKTADDYFYAAMVFQHGDSDDDIAKAHELSLKAAEIDPVHEVARWLAAASKDRLLMRQGKPQLYGTQFTKVNGKWVLHEVDPSITDEERAKWDCPPLAEARKRLDVLNAGESH